MPSSVLDPEDTHRCTDEMWEPPGTVKTGRQQKLRKGIAWDLKVSRKFLPGIVQMGQS